MRIFRNKDSSTPAERAAARGRLNAVMGRIQAEFELYSKPQATEEPEKIYRRFWSPAELAEVSHGA